MFRKSGLLVVVCVVAITVGFSGIVQGTLLTPTADSFVKSDQASDNFGADSFLQIKETSDLGGTRKVWLQFNVSGIENASTAVSSATLSLPFVYSGLGAFTNGDSYTFDYHVYGLNNAASGQNWVEGTGTYSSPASTGINWNNAPGNETTTNSVIDTQVTSLGSFSITGTGIGQTFTVSGANLVNFLNADTNGLATIIVLQATPQDDPSENYVHAIGSIQGSAHATLDVTTTAVPEPTGLVLLATALLGLAAYAWRKRK
jgi:hypothetical protein